MSSYSFKTPIICLSGITRALKVLIGAQNSRRANVFFSWFHLFVFYRFFCKVLLVQSATVSSTRGGWCNTSCIKKWNMSMCSFLLYAVALQSSFSTADCGDVFLTRDLGRNLCHYQSARPSWCHPDAPSWNTHRPLCLLHFRFRGLFFFSPCWTCTNTYKRTHTYTNSQA